MRHHNHHTTPRTTKEPSQLSLLASYAHRGQSAIGSQFGLGEGLVGQCALEKQKILLTNVPPDYIRISSGLGSAPPHNILVLPVVDRQVGQAPCQPFRSRQRRN